MANEKYDLLRAHAAQLAEHFESVQIIATHVDSELDATVLTAAGQGNMYARLGSTATWLDSYENLAEPLEPEKGDG